MAATLGGVADADPKRDKPDYDGRGNPDTDADWWALWIARVALAPLYLSNEYVLRRPLGSLVQTAERERWADSVGDRSVLVPTFAFDRGLVPSAGLYFATHRAFVAGNTLRVAAATWGAPFVAATAEDRYALDRSASVAARVTFTRAADNLFFGVGPFASDAMRSRYGLTRVAGSVAYRRSIAAGARVDVATGVQRVGFFAGGCCGDATLDARIADGQLTPPPGYGDSYTVAVTDVALTIGERAPRTSGAYLRVHAAPSFDVQQRRSWLAYGGVVGAAVDLTGHRRTLYMQLALDFVDALGAAAIPFTEYPTLGGDAMPGFVPGWMLGRSTAAAQLGYRWPVWLWLSGQARFTLGNAFDEHLAGLATRELRMSADVGVTTRTDHDQGFEVLVGFGTTTLAQGADITSARVTFGAQRVF